MQRGRIEMCGKNTYPTTLHIINSAVLKLSKLTKAVKVYRGMASGVLPKAFWKPNDYHVRGGIVRRGSNAGPSLIAAFPAPCRLLP